MGDCGSLWVITFVVPYYFVDLFFVLNKIINFLLKCFYEMGIVRWGLSGMGTVRWELSGMGIVRDGNCPSGGNCPGWELSGMGIVRIPCKHILTVHLSTQKDYLKLII